MLWLILGDYGSGKTLFMTRQGVISEREVLGNYTINIDNYQKIDPLDLKDIGFNRLVLLDEIYTWLESRISSSHLNLYLTSITSQSRHRTIDVMGTLHLFSSVDIRFRAMVHRIVKCSRIPSKKKPQEEWDFNYKIMNTYSGKTISKTLRYRNAIKYFPLYDTYELIEPIDIGTMEIELYRKYPRRLAVKLKEIARELKRELDPITHDSVGNALLDMGYNLNWTGLVYSRIKNLD